MGTNYLAPTWRQPENLNKDRLSNYSIYFAGTVRDDIELGTTTFLLPGQPSSPSTSVSNPKFSASIFFKFDSSVAGSLVLMIGAGQGGGAAYWNLRKTTGDNLEANFRTTNSTYATITGGTTLTSDTWYHACVTWDGNNINLYLNGISDATQVAATTFYYGSTIAYPTIGSFRYSSTQATNLFIGELSQATIFDYALSTDQVTYLSNVNNPLVISGAEPIAYWPLGDNSNPTATAGYPNIVSDADSVFDFGTSNEEIDTPGPYTDGTQGDLTISAWVKQDSITTSYRPFICTGFTSSMTQPQVAMALRNVGGNRLYLFYNGGGGSNYIYAQNVMTEANRWYHCAFVRSGSTGKLYVDGQEVSTLNSADFSVSPQVTTADSEMTLGGWRYSGSNESLNGELSNVCLWKTALTDGVGGQIEELYNNGMPLLELSEIPQNNNLLGWYKLNQSAVLTPGVPTNWTITKVGSPNYSGSNDGCYAGTSGTSPYNSGLVWHDNNSATVGSDYFQWNSPIIYTSGSNIVLSSSGGSWVTPSGGGNQAILEYNIDDGSWVSWHTQTNGIDGFGVNNFTIPSTGNLTVSNNIKIRIKGVDFGASASYLKINDINATGGTSSYNESFTNATRYGFSGGSETQPPATFSADNWEIPDNRSAYPQSFDFSDTSYIKVNRSTSIEPAKNLTISVWVNWKTGSNTFSYAINKDYNGSNGSYAITRVNQPRFYIFTSTGVVVSPIASSVNLTNTGWHHLVGTYDGSYVRFYVDGEEIGSGTAETGDIIYNTEDLIIGAYQSSGNLSPNGEQSNVQIWDSALPATGSNSIETLYNNGVPLPTASVEPSSLKVWAKLDSSSKWNTITSQWNIPLNPITPTPWSKSAIAKSNSQTFVNNTSASGIDLTNPTTCSFWIRTATTQADFAISAGSFGGGNDLAVIGSRILVYRGASNYRYWNFNSSIINDDNWHNIVIYSPGYAKADIGSTRMFMDGLELPIDTTLQSSLPGTPNNNPILGVGNIYVDMISASFSNAVIWASDQTSNINEIYNNGTPSSSYTNTPILWWELNNLTSGLDDLSGNNNNGITSGPVFTVTEEDIIAYQLGVSDGMTEANLIDENVSTVNGESDTLPASALVQSDLTRKLPFSNYSIDFDSASADYMQVPDPGSSVLAYGENKFSFSGWINPTTFVNQGGLIARYKNSTSRTTLKGSYQNGFDGLMFQSVDDPSAPNFHITWDNILTANEWQHVCLIYDGANTSCTMYINGVDQGAGVIMGVIPTSLPDFSGYPIDIAVDAMNGLNNRNYDGQFSNFAIFDSILTQEEVLDLYNNGVPSNLNTSFTPGKPEAWWPMDEDYTYFNGSVLVARDAVGSNDGTGVNIIQENIVGNAPGSEGNGTGTNLTIADLKGDMKNSINNSYSINMADYADGVTNPANSGRSTNVP